MIGQSSGKVMKSAGMVYLGSDAEEDKRAVIPSKSYLNFENACPLNLTKVLHPFAVRPNTNGRGIVVSVWRISEDGVWTLMGRYNPNPLQAYYLLRNDSLELRPNDWMAMRCTVYNDQDHDIYYGLDDASETCNSYTMYYVDGNDVPSLDDCESYGPPYYSWATDPNIPGTSVPEWVDIESSRLKFDQ